MIIACDNLAENIESYIDLIKGAKENGDKVILLTSDTLEYKADYVYANGEPLHYSLINLFDEVKYCE